MSNNPSIGRIVHFLQNGVHYPALVVKVWTPITINILVFPNGSDTITPGALDTQGIAHSVNWAAAMEGKEWSWHWPEPVE